MGSLKTRCLYNSILIPLSKKTFLAKIDVTVTKKKYKKPSLIRSFTVAQKNTWLIPSTVASAK
jgi:hypothetical protein